MIIAALARELKVEATMLNAIFSAEHAPTLEIAWRNPSPVIRRVRQHSLAGTGECAIYIQKEFVTEGQYGYWTTISELEVVVGGRAA